MKDAFNLISTLLIYAQLNLLNLFSRQNLGRRLEPELITTNADAVEDYNRVGVSTLTIIYALSLQILRPLIKAKTNIKILDLACGPALFSRLLTENLSASSFTGVDLSQPMIDVAKRRFASDLPGVAAQFIKHDISNLSFLKDESFDLVTFMNAAHHLPTLDQVKKTMLEANRVCKPDGIIILADHARPRNEKLLRLYYDWISEKNKAHLMKAHNVDFLNSLYAGWSIEDFSQMVSHDKARTWFHIYPPGFQYIRYLVGVPKGGEEISLVHLRVNASKKMIPREYYLSIWSVALLSFKYFAKIERHR